MQNKTYTLVVWTVNGKVRMIPSVADEAAQPYRQEIAELEAKWGYVRNRSGLLLALSQAHERFARALDNAGFVQESKKEFELAAYFSALRSGRKAS